MGVIDEERGLARTGAPNFLFIRDRDHILSPIVMSPSDIPKWDFTHVPPRSPLRHR